MHSRRSLLKMTGGAVFASALAGRAGPALAGSRPFGSVAWAELSSDYPDISKNFYKAMFGWSFKTRGSGPVVISAGGATIGTMVPSQGRAVTNRASSQWAPVFAVTDALKTANTARSFGAELLGTPKNTGDGNYVSMRDNMGALVSFYDGDLGINRSKIGAPNYWMWIDLFTNNSARSEQFYRGVLGFSVSSESRSGSPNLSLFTGADGLVKGGMVPIPGSQVNPNWLPYVHVTNLDTAISKAKSNGARILMSTNTAAVVIDPTNAAIGLTVRGGAN